MPGWYCCSISCWGWGPPCCSSSWWVWEWNWPEVGVVCEWIVVTLVMMDCGHTDQWWWQGGDEESSPAGVRSVRVGQVYCKLPPEVKSIFGWLLIINLKHFTYVQLPCSSLAVSPGWCPQRTWWTASLQRKSGSKTPEVSTLYSPPLEICQIFLSAKKILILNASPSTLRGTTSWRSSIGIFLTTVLRDSDTVDFDSNSSTECSNTKTPLKPYVICKEDKVGPKECEGHWETYIMDFDQHIPALLGYLIPVRRHEWDQTPCPSSCRCLGCPWQRWQESSLHGVSTGHMKVDW